MSRIRFTILSLSLFSLGCLEPRSEGGDAAGQGADGEASQAGSGDDSSSGGNNCGPGSVDGNEGEETCGGGVDDPESGDTGEATQDPNETGDTGGGTAGGETEGNSVVVAHTGLSKPLPPTGSSGTLTMVSDAVVSGTIADVNVSIDLDHTCTKDLSAVLESPSGTSVILFDLGVLPVCSSDLQNTQLDDEAYVSITRGSSPFTGSHQPTGSLANFDGEDAGGVWTLSITDDTIGDVGTLNSWSIELLLD